MPTWPVTLAQIVHAAKNGALTLPHRANTTLLRSFLRRALSWSSTLYLSKQILIRETWSVKLHGVVHADTDVQVRRLPLCGVKHIDRCFSLGTI